MQNASLESYPQTFRESTCYSGEGLSYRDPLSNVTAQFIQFSVFQDQLCHLPFSLDLPCLNLLYHKGAYNESLRHNCQAFSL